MENLRLNLGGFYLNVGSGSIAKIIITDPYLPNLESDGSTIPHLTKRRYR